MTLPDAVEGIQAALVVGTLLAIFAVAAGISDVLDRFDTDDDGHEDTA